MKQYLFFGYFIFLALAVLSRNPLMLILCFLFFDKIFLSIVRIHGYFGIDLILLPTALAGIRYGPAGGFLFGFIALPLADIFRWIVAPPFEPASPPGIPSLSSLLYGLAGIASGLVAGHLSVPVIVIIAALVENSLHALTRIMFSDISDEPMPVFSYVLNVMYNSILAYTLEAIGILAFILA